MAELGEEDLAEVKWGAVVLGEGDSARVESEAVAWGEEELAWVKWGAVMLGEEDSARVDSYPALHSIFTQYTSE